VVCARHVGLHPLLMEGTIKGMLTALILVQLIR
jgi:hypothetical protein